MKETKRSHVTTEEIVEQAREAGIEVWVVTPEASGEIVLLPGLRRDEFDEFVPERDDDGTGLIE